MNPSCLAIAALIAALFVLQPAARADDEVNIQLTLKDHRFSPAEVHAPANKPITITLKNLDPISAEFESNMLRVEKVVTGGGTITRDRKSTRLNSSHLGISYAVF